MENLFFSADALNKIFAYLGTKPYQEVFQLIEILQNEIKNQTKTEQPAVEQIAEESVKVE